MTHENLQRSTKTVTNDDQRLRLNLKADRCWASPREARIRVMCMDGTVWVSEAGNPNDILLAPGQVWMSSGRGKVVLQGLPTTLVEVTRVPLKPWRWRWHKLAALLNARQVPIPQWK